MQRLIRAVRGATNILLGKKTAGRHLTVYPDDIFLVSYPRSGNTWTRFLIGNLVNQDEPITFKNLESRIPEIYLFPDRVLRSFLRPRILKSHECFDPRYERIIYIVRDPRDVAVSYYHYAIKRCWIEPDCAIDQFVPRLIAGEFDVRAGWAACWGDHVRSWVSLRGDSKGFCLLRYEDLIRNAQHELARAARFFQIEPTPERLKRAVELSSADHLRQLEKKEGRQWPLTKKTRPDKPFVRTATSGSWQQVLPASSVAFIESRWGPLMRSLGYVLSTGVPATNQGSFITAPS
jgi:Sulfotransferase domain